MAPHVVHRVADVHEVAGRVGQQGLARVYWRWLRWRDSFVPELIDSLVRPGDVVVDVGGAWGAFAYQFARCVGPTGHVHVFEPHPANYGSLDAIRGARKYITVHHMGLSNHAGEVELRAPVVRGRHITNLSSMVAPASAEIRYERIFVHVDRLDAVLTSEPRPVAFIKCDVEGHELAVLQGAVETIRRWRPTLLVEIEQRHCEVSIRAVGDYLAELGYAGYAVYPCGLKNIEAFDVQRDQLAHLGPRVDVYGVPSDYINDFLFIPRDADHASIAPLLCLTGE